MREKDPCPGCDLPDEPTTPIVFRPWGGELPKVTDADYDMMKREIDDAIARLAPAASRWLWGVEPAKG